MTREATALTTLAQTLIVTAEVLGHELSAGAAGVMARDLAEYPADAVAKALRRCRREERGRLTLAAVIARIDDGHLGADAAWALCTADEAATVVWTDEIADAFGACRGLLRDGDTTAARMAFRETYARNVQAARDQRRSASWWASLGHDKASRIGPIMSAVESARLTPDAARALISPDCPGYEHAAERLRLIAGEPARKPLASSASHVAALSAGIGKVVA